MRIPTLCLATAVWLIPSAGLTLSAQPLANLQREFQTPPPDTRPMVRWWWFGPAVVQPELQHEMQLMHEGGFGGFEVQPTYPLALDGQYPGLKNLKFLSPEFFGMLGFVAQQSRALGLRMDLTLGSGWPYGGPMFSRAEAAQSIADGGTVPVRPGQTAVTAPAVAHHGAAAAAPVIAALLGPIADAKSEAERYIALAMQDRTAQLPTDLRGATQVRFFTYAPAGLMQVKRAAYGDEGFIIDHYSRAAVDKFIRAVATPEIAACGSNPPYSVFCDSLEVAGEGWTPGFPEFFRERHGYDLIPLLPALFDADYPHAAEIRGDYGEAITALFDQAFVGPFAAEAKAHGTRFRLQAYGTPPTTLSTYAHVDVDEGENYNWRLFSGTRWAASASHVLGRQVTSAEAFTWLHSPVFMAAPIDIKAESNLQFLNGVNELLYHGWPYTAPGVEYPGWRFYAAAVFNEKNPWWIAMPAINDYLARTCHLLRQGVPANDVAVYLPEEDAYTAMTPTNLQMVQAGGNGILNQRVNPLVPAILDAGLNFDGIDAGVLASHGRVDGAQLAFGDVHYHAVVLPRMTHITPAALRTFEAFADGGGLLVAVDAAPSVAPGYHPTPEDTQSVAEISARLFRGPKAKGLVVPFAQLSAVLRERLTPDVAFADSSGTLGFVHRKTAEADVYFIANTTHEPITTSATLRTSGPAAAWWDATTGRSHAAQAVRRSAQSLSVAIDLAPYEARFLIVSAAGGDTPAQSHETATTDLSRAWSVSFKNASPEPNPAAMEMTTLASWTDRPATKYFAGVATYTKHVTLAATTLAAGSIQHLDFGLGAPAAVAGGEMGMHADYQPPVADAAVIYVNGQKAGTLWCPPYRIDVTGLLRAGENEIRVEVANRACNYMADTTHHPLPDYHALNANRELGGNRFQPQDLSALRVTPSGLLGPVYLIVQ